MATTQIRLDTQAQDATLTNAKIANDQITNTKINSAAAIDFSKLASLTAGNILVGNGSNVATSTTVSGDITINSSGATAIAAGVIVDADINAAAAISLSKLAEAVIQADGGQAFTADQSMGGFKLTSVGTPTATGDAATKGYVDSLTTGLAWKNPVRCGTVSDLETATSSTWIANNGTPATGEFTYNTTTLTLTWFTSEGPTTIDGVTLVNDDRILVKAETASSGPAGGDGRPYQGIYVRTSQDVWTRAEDSDASAEFEAQAVFIQEGTVEANRGYTQTADSVTMDTTALSYALFTATNGDANTLDSLDSTQFLRSDANDSVTTGVTLNIDSGATLSIDGAWDIGGTTVTSNATEINLLDGLTGTIWTSDNDGAASGLDADLLDGQQGSSYLRSDANDSVTTGVTLNIDSGATLSIDGTWDIGGTAVTANAAELNILDGATVTTTELNNLGTIVVREVPTGLINSSNTTYTLANTPIAGSEEVFLNGLLQNVGAGNDYTISGGTITFNTAPTTGSVLLVSYRH